jgi:transcriptional regulator with XRE-family HTH domain
LAKKIGKTRQTIYTWEHNLFVPDIEDIKKISNKTGMELGYFIDNSITIGNISGDKNIIGQNVNSKSEQQQKEIELLKRELEIVKKEKELLKKK